MGLIAAVEAFLQGDEEQEMAELRRKCEMITDQLAEVPDISATVEQDDVLYPTPHAVVRLTSSWRGRSPEEIIEALWNGTPSIRANELTTGPGVTFSPFNPTDEEVETAAARLREELLSQ